MLWVRKHKNIIGIIFLSIALIIAIKQIKKQSLAYLLAIISLIILGLAMLYGFVNTATLITSCSLVTVFAFILLKYVDIQESIIAMCFGILVIALFVLYMGIRLMKCFISISTEKKRNKNEDSYFFSGIGLIIIGGVGSVIAGVTLIKDIAVYLSGKGISNPLTGVTIIVTVITFIVGSIIKLFINKKENERQLVISREEQLKQSQISLHKEMDWRKQLHELETKEQYTIGDLIKLNSFFNPYDKKKKDIDYKLNRTIKNIVSRHAKPINPNKQITLFDYKLTEKIQKERISVKDTQRVRELIHKLLKNDWETQTKPKKGS